MTATQSDVVAAAHADAARGHRVVTGLLLAITIASLAYFYLLAAADAPAWQLSWTSTIAMICLYVREAMLRKRLERWISRRAFGRGDS